MIHDCKARAMHTMYRQWSQSGGWEMHLNIGSVKQTDKGYRILLVHTTAAVDSHSRDFPSTAKC